MKSTDHVGSFVFPWKLSNLLEKSISQQRSPAYTVQAASHSFLKKNFSRLLCKSSAVTSSLQALEILITNIYLEMSAFMTLLLTSFDDSCIVSRKSLLFADCLSRNLMSFPHCDTLFMKTSSPPRTCNCPPCLCTRALEVQWKQA